MRIRPLQPTSGAGKVNYVVGTMSHSRLSGRALGVEQQDEKETSGGLLRGSRHQLP
jgi:hypothetical protein